MLSTVKDGFIVKFIVIAPVFFISKIAEVLGKKNPSVILTLVSMVILEQGAGVEDAIQSAV